MDQYSDGFWLWRGAGAGVDDVLPFFTETLDDDRGHHSSRTGSIQRPRIENVYTLHFPENFESLETSRLFVVCRDGARDSTGTDEIFLSLDLYLLSISVCFGGNYILRAGSIPLNVLIWPTMSLDLLVSRRIMVVVKVRLAASGSTTRGEAARRRASAKVRCRSIIVF